MPTKPLEGRVTLALIKALLWMLEHSGEKFYGSELADATKLGSGTIYPLLGRLTTSGWLKAEYDQTDPNQGRQPRRRYLLTGPGYNAARKVLEENLSPEISDGLIANFNSN